MPRSSPATTPPPTVAAVGRQGRSPNPAAPPMPGPPAGLAALAGGGGGRRPCRGGRFVTRDRPRPRGERLCEVCWWSAERDPLGDGGGLPAARRSFARCGACDERFADRVRRPLPDELPPWRAA